MRQLIFGGNPRLLILMAAHITSPQEPRTMTRSRERLRGLKENLIAGIPKLLAAADLITELTREASDVGAT
jgi:hypothetical protein